jgi:CPA2 family monovalent cation:H+ antiporter-2
VHELPLLRDLVVVLAVAVAVVLLVARLGLPSVAGLVLAGIVAGPHALGLVRDPHRVELLAEVGVVLLLFGVGLELPTDRLKRLWRPIVLGGSLQVLLTGLAALAGARWLGFDWPAAALVAFVVVPSSTAIVLRGLEARGEIDAPHGRLVLGILLFQDLCVVPMMLVLPAIRGGSAGAIESLGLGILKSALLLGLVVLGAQFVVPRALRLVAATRQRDVFVLAVLLACMGIAWLASAAGVSLALGAFLGGVVVAGSAYRHQATSDLLPLREVLASLFFVSTGMLLDTTLVRERPGAVLGLLLALLAGKAAIVMLAGALLRLPLRVAVLAGVGLAQLGEFALVLLRSAHGVLPQRSEDLLVTSVILSMAVTPLLLAAGPRVAVGAERLRGLSLLFGVPGAHDARHAKGGLEGHVVLAGYGVAGRQLAAELRELAVPFVIVDLNAATVSEATLQGERAYFGDVTSAEVLEHLGLRSARGLVLLINDAGALERAVSAAHALAPDVPVAVRARYVGDIAKLERAGATEVVAAELEAGRELTRRVLARLAQDASRARG